MKITYILPSTNFVRPSDVQLGELMTIALAANPYLAEHASETRDFKAQFRRAFIAIGYMWRTEPDPRRYFHAHVDSINDLLEARFDVVDPVDGPAVMAAIVAHGDVKYISANSRIGQLLEIGLNVSTGQPCGTPNAWEAVLATGGLLEPLPPRGFVKKLEADRAPRPHFYRDGRLIDDRELWGPR